MVEMTGKQAMSSFKKEHSKYEAIKEKLKETANAELSLTKDIVTKAESIANSSVVEIIHADLPSDWQKRQIVNVPPFFNMLGTVDNDKDFQNVLAAGIQASFGNVHIST